MFRVGIIGCGAIARSHCEGFGETGRARVAYAFDTDSAASARLAGEWGAEAVASAEELVSASDVVVIATPGFARLRYVELAAAAGRPILCEKPVALSLEEAEAVREVVRQAGVTFMVAFNHRYVPAFVQLKALADSGRLGGVVSAWARWYAPTPSARWRSIVESGHWRSSAELSGGRINEFCSHAVNWLLWVLGRPQTVYGRALCVTEGFTLDDADYALLQCERGVGLLEVNRHAGVAPEENYGIMGHGGSAVLRDGRVWLTPMDGETVEVPIGGSVVTKHSHFLDCVERGAKPLTDIDDAIDTLRVCLAFNRSARSNAVEVV